MCETKKERTLPVSLAPLFFHTIGIINQLHDRRDTLNAKGSIRINGGVTHAGPR